MLQMPQNWPAHSSATFMLVLLVLLLVLPTRQKSLVHIKKEEANATY
jgi:hypothetical protein